MKNKSPKKDILPGNSQIALNENSVRISKHRKRNKKFKKPNPQQSEVKTNHGHVVLKNKAAIQNSGESTAPPDYDCIEENISKKKRKKAKKQRVEAKVNKTQTDLEDSLNDDGKPMSYEDMVFQKKGKNKVQNNIVELDVPNKLGDIELSPEPMSKSNKKIKKENSDKLDLPNQLGDVKMSPESMSKRNKKRKKKNNGLNANNDFIMDETDLKCNKSELEVLSEDEVKSQTSELDLDSYPSDTDEEIYGTEPKVNFADYSSDESYSLSSDNESHHTFDPESYSSDTEDEDEKKKGLPKKSIPSAELEEKEKRTVFVGNLPKSVERNNLKKWFSKFGKVECVRLRSAPIADPELPRKVAVIKKTFHEERSNIHAYVRFKTIEAAKNAIQANGAVYQDHVIRVDNSIHEGKYDSNKAVFVGNVPFSLEENALRNFFLDCGDIDNVRIIRDKNTGVGKGFAYVNFKCSTSVPLALKLDGEILEKRELRVKPIKYQKKNAKTFLKRPVPQYHSKKFYNKSKTNVTKNEKFQGEFSQKKTKKNPKKKTLEERKREKFSKILSSKNKKNV